jgi:hypothetical protein
MISLLRNVNRTHTGINRILKSKLSTNASSGSNTSRKSNVFADIVKGVSISGLVIGTAVGGMYVFDNWNIIRDRLSKELPTV